MKKQIVKTYDTDWNAHRGDFQTCPHCGFKQDNKKWEKAACILAIEPKHWKSGSVASITECPKCFEKSWVHEPFDSFTVYSDWPKDWVKAVEKRDAKVRLAALREWAIGLCGRCKHLSEGRVDHTTHRTCLRGFGPVQTECEKFKPCKSLNGKK